MRGRKRAIWNAMMSGLLAAVLVSTAAILPMLFAGEGGKKVFARAFSPLPTWEEYTAGPYEEKNVLTLSEFDRATNVSGTWRSPAESGIDSAKLILTLSTADELYNFSYRMYGALVSGSTAQSEQALAFYAAPERVYMLGNNIVWSGEGNTNFLCVNDFSGAFDGQGFEITGLTLDTRTVGAGGGLAMFASVAAGGRVERLGLIRPAVDALGSTRSAAGLAAVNAGTVRHCFVRMEDGTVAAGPQYAAAGIAAVNTGAIVNCYFAGKLTGGTMYGVAPGSVDTDSCFDASLAPLAAGSGVDTEALSAMRGVLSAAEDGARVFYSEESGGYPRLYGARSETVNGTTYRVLSRPADLVYMGASLTNNDASRFAIDRCIDMSAVSNKAYCVADVNFKGGFSSVRRLNESGAHAACSSLHPTGCGEEVEANHAVINLHLTEPGGANGRMVGLFPASGSDLAVENVNFIGGLIRPEFAASTGSPQFFVSLLGGSSSENARGGATTLRNVHSSCDIDASRQPDIGKSIHIGGLIARTAGTLNVENCSVSGVVDGGSNRMNSVNYDTSNVGGLIGNAGVTSCAVTNAVFGGTVYGVRFVSSAGSRGYNLNAGGLFGNLNVSGSCSLIGAENAGSVYTSREDTDEDIGSDSISGITNHAGGIAGQLNAAFAAPASGFSVKNSGNVYIREYTGSYTQKGTVKVYAATSNAGGICGSSPITQGFSGAVSEGGVSVVTSTAAAKSVLANTVSMGGLTGGSGNFSAFSGSCTADLSAETWSSRVSLYGLAANAVVGYGVPVESGAKIFANGNGVSTLAASGMFGSVDASSGAYVNNLTSLGSVRVVGGASATAAGLLLFGTAGVAVTNCVNAANVQAEAVGKAVAAGIAASTVSSVSDSFNCGNISASGGAASAGGGIVGEIPSGASLQYHFNNTNVGEVTGPIAGGIVGAALGQAALFSAMNTGAVSGATAGGLAGKLSAGSALRGGKNTGAVTGDTVGGIAGNWAAVGSYSYLVNFAAAERLFGNVASAVYEEYSYNFSGMSAEAIFAADAPLRLQEDAAEDSSEYGGRRYPTLLIYSEYGLAPGATGYVQTYALLSREGRTHGAYLPTTTYTGTSALVASGLAGARQLEFSRDCEVDHAESLKMTGADGSIVNPVYVTDYNAEGAQGLIRFNVNMSTYPGDGAYTLSTLYPSGRAFSPTLQLFEEGGYIDVPAGGAVFALTFDKLFTGESDTTTVSRLFRITQPGTGAQKLWLISVSFTPTESVLNMPHITSTGSISGSGTRYELGYETATLSAEFTTFNLPDHFTVEVYRGNRVLNSVYTFEAPYPTSSVIYTFGENPGRNTVVRESQITVAGKEYTITETKMTFTLTLDRDFPSGEFEIRVSYNGSLSGSLTNPLMTLSFTKAQSGYAELRAGDPESATSYLDESGAPVPFRRGGTAAEQNAALFAELNRNMGVRVDWNFGAVPYLAVLAEGNALALFRNIAISPFAGLAAVSAVAVTSGTVDVTVDGASYTLTLYTYTLTAEVTSEDGRNVSRYAFSFAEALPVVSSSGVSVATSETTKATASVDNPTRFEIAKNVQTADGAFAVNFLSNWKLAGVPASARSVSATREGEAADFSGGNAPDFTVSAGGAISVQFHPTDTGGLYEFWLSISPFAMQLGSHIAVTHEGAAVTQLEHSMGGGIRASVFSVEKAASRNSFASGMWFQYKPAVEDISLYETVYNVRKGGFVYGPDAGTNGWGGTFSYLDGIDRDYKTPYRNFLINLQYANDETAFYTPIRLYPPVDIDGLVTAALYYQLVDTDGQPDESAWIRVGGEAQQPLTEYANVVYKVVAENPSYSCLYTVRVASVPRNKTLELEVKYANGTPPPAFFAAVVKTQFVNTDGTRTVTRQTTAWFGAGNTVTAYNHIQAYYLLDFILPSGYAVSWTWSVNGGPQQPGTSAGIDCNNGYTETVKVILTVSKAEDNWGIESWN